MAKSVKEVVGSITEHWIDVRLRLGLPTVLEGNVPRMSATTAVKLNDLRNKLLGTNYTLYELEKARREGSTDEIKS